MIVLIYTLKQMKQIDNPHNLRVYEREIVSALIFSADNKLLMGKKDPNLGGVYNDVWHIPGGGIDNNENLEVGLIREIKEEVGLDIKENQILLIDNKGKGSTEKTLKDTGEKVWCVMNFNVYKVNLDKDSKNIKLSTNDDLKILEWIDLKELTNYKLTPPSIELFKRLGYLR